MKKTEQIQTPAPPAMTPTETSVDDVAGDPLQNSGFEDQDPEPDFEEGA